MDKQKSIWKSLGEKLRELRTAAGLSQVKLADKAGIRQPSISAAERGETGLAAETLVRVSAALGVPIETFAAVIAPDVTLPLPNVVFTLPVAGVVGAGPGQDHCEPGEVITSDQVFPGATCSYRVRGDSMADAGIVHGDHVVVKEADAAQARQGETVVAWLADVGEHVVKIIKGNKGGRRWLEGRNAAADPHKEQRDLGADDRVCGVVIGVIGRRGSKPTRK